MKYEGRKNGEFLVSMSQDEFTTLMREHGADIRGVRQLYRRPKRDWRDEVCYFVVQKRWSNNNEDGNDPDCEWHYDSSCGTPTCGITMSAARKALQLIRFCKSREYPGPFGYWQYRLVFVPVQIHSSASVTTTTNNTQRKVRATATVLGDQVRRLTGPGACVQAYQLPMGMRAMFAYHGAIRFSGQGDDSDACRIVIQRDSGRTQLDDAPPVGDWQVAYETTRRARYEEVFRIWVRRS